MGLASPGFCKVLHRPFNPEWFKLFLIVHMIDMSIFLILEPGQLYYSEGDKHMFAKFRGNTFLPLMTILIIGLLISCGSTDNPTGSRPQPFEIGQFPHGTGTQWVYKVTDSASATIDTLTVTVVPDTSVPPSGYSSLENWVYTAPGAPAETMQVVYSNSSVEFWSPVGPILITFPLNVAPESVTVPTGKFGEAYKVSDGYNSLGGGLYFLVDYWLVKDKGIVKYEFNSNATTPKLHYTAELISYHSAPGPAR